MQHNALMTNNKELVYSEYIEIWKTRTCEFFEGILICSLGFDDHLLHEIAEMLEDVVGEKMVNELVEAVL